jgi:hypothetical protein
VTWEILMATQDMEFPSCLFHADPHRQSAKRITAEKIQIAIRHEKHRAKRVHRIGNKIDRKKICRSRQNQSKESQLNLRGKLPGNLNNLFSL